MCPSRSKPLDCICRRLSSEQLCKYSSKRYRPFEDATVDLDMLEERAIATSTAHDWKAAQLLVDEADKLILKLVRGRVELYLRWLRLHRFREHGAQPRWHARP